MQSCTLQVLIFVALIQVNLVFGLMDTIRCLLVDDEEPARALVRRYLNDYPTIEIIGECADGFSGAKSINELKPDLVFLDVQMPKLTGFEVLELIEHQPCIVFATAYDEFAIKAFEKNAVDYLMKPFSKERFASAIGKVTQRIAQQQPATGKQQIAALNQTIEEQQDEEISRIAVKSGSRIHVIAVEQIICLEAEGDYVMIHTRDGQFLKEKTMKFFENTLNKQQFVRIHRSSIVNVAEIARIEQFEKDSYIAILKNNYKLKLSQSGYKTLKTILKM